MKNSNRKPKGKLATAAKLQNKNDHAKATGTGKPTVIQMEEYLRLLDNPMFTSQDKSRRIAEAIEVKTFDEMHSKILNLMKFINKASRSEHDEEYRLIHKDKSYE